MNFRVELVPGEPILVCVILLGFLPHEDFPRLIAALRALLDAAAEPLVMVSRVEMAGMTFFSMLEYLALLTRGPDPLLKHPRLDGVFILVRPPSLTWLAARSARRLLGPSFQPVAAPGLDMAIHAARQRIEARRRRGDS